MISTKPIEERYGRPICRRCINKAYHVKLIPEDCVYGYVYSCPVCNENRNIVVGFRKTGKVKMFFK